jgi:hypothetical protein
MPIASLMIMADEASSERSHEHEGVSRPTVSGLDVDTPTNDARGRDCAFLDVQPGLAPRGKLQTGLSCTVRTLGFANPLCRKQCCVT